jgi:hypothetical protein
LTELRLSCEACVTEPPKKLGVHLPRSDRLIFNEARMRKHITEAYKSIY